MATMAHEPTTVGPKRFSWPALPELWASLAIVVIWLAVLFDAVFGADIKTVSGGAVSTVPSAIPVAFFAFLATIPVAKYGFKHDR